MMLPARTVSLPNFFTPRRLLSLSRPLRDEPPAFLCAMSDYFFFGDFLAAPLAGAAFSVDAVFAVGLLLALAFAGFGVASAVSAAGLACASLSGAGFSVGSALTCAASAFFELFAGAGALAGASGAGAASAFFAGFSALWSPIATMRRIVCCWRWPFLRR